MTTTSPLTQAASRSAPWLPDNAQNFEKVTLAGDYAYLADYDTGLRVVDISNPSRPVEAGYYPVPGYDKRIATANGYIYVAAGKSGLFVFQAA